MDEMRARHADGIPIQTQTPDIIQRRMRPSLSEQINVFGHLAEGNIEILDELPPAKSPAIAQ